MEEKLEKTFTENIETYINLRLKDEFSNHEVIFVYYDGNVYFKNKVRVCDMKICLCIDNNFYEVIHTEKKYIGTHKEDVYRMCVDFVREILKIKDFKLEINRYTTYTYNGDMYNFDGIQNILHKKINEHLYNNTLCDFSETIQDILIEEKENYFFNGIKTTLYTYLFMKKNLHLYNKNK